MGQAAAATPFGPIMQAVSGAVSGVGSIIGSQSTASNYKFQAAQAIHNAAIAKQNAAMAGQAGSEQAYGKSLGTASQVGGERVNQAAGGVNVNSGSAVDTQTSTEQLGKLDALTIRSEATKHAYGYATEAANDLAQASADKAAASNALKEGWIKAGASLLGSSADSFTQYQQGKSQGLYGGDISQDTISPESLSFSGTPEDLSGVS